MPDASSRLSGARSTLGVKAPCRVATTASITLSGLQTVDGVALAENDRVLVKDQTDATTNGIRVASSSAWARAVDWDGNTDVVQGTQVYVANGATGSGMYVMTSADPVSIGTSDIDFLLLRTILAMFSVVDSGAVGDGATDDSDAFQAAVDAADASETAKTVYVPHSSDGYALGATITVPAGVLIKGDNRKGLELSRIKPASGFTGPLFQSEGYGVSRVLRIGLEGLFLDGSSTTLSAVRANCQESHFRDLTIKNCFTYGIYIGGISSGASDQALNNHIEDCYLAGQIGVTEFFDGIFIDYFSADNTIENTYVEACKDAGIRSRGYNNKFTNNHIYSVAGTGGGVGAGIYTETSADHDISQNYIELCAAEGILMAGGASDVGTLAATVNGNVFRNIDTGNTSNGVIEISGSDVSAITAANNIVRRDAATSYATPYFVYFNGIAPTLAHVFGNSWQASLVTIDETNIPLGLSLPTGAAISWNAGDVLVTHSANSLSLTGASSGYLFDARISSILNSSAGTSEIRVQNSSTSNGTTKLAKYSGYGIDTAGSTKEVGRVEFQPADSNWVGAETRIYSRTADVVTERLRLDSVGNVVAPYSTAALSTAATAGLFYIPTSTAASTVAPLGTPTAYPGMVPMIYNSAQNRLWIFSGSTWRATAALTTI